MNCDGEEMHVHQLMESHASGHDRDDHHNELLFTNFLTLYGWAVSAYGIALTSSINSHYFIWAEN